MNTQASKLVVNEITQAMRETITSLQSKLQSFFSLFKSNPNAYELVSNPNLESKDYQSPIEPLLDTNSNALYIGMLLHSFPNYFAYTNTTHSIAKSTNYSSLSNSPDSIPMCIKAQWFNHKNEPLVNKEIYVYSPNFTSFVDKAKSDDSGYYNFNNACISSNTYNILLFSEYQYKK